MARPIAWSPSQSPDQSRDLSAHDWWYDLARLVARSCTTCLRPLAISNFLKELNDFRTKHAKNFITYHLNVNGIRNKFVEVTDILTNNNVDIFFLSETKIDESFPEAQFRITGFKSYRADRNSCGGVVMAIIRNDIPHRRRNDVEKKYL